MRKMWFYIFSALLCLTGCSSEGTAEANENIINVKTEQIINSSYENAVVYSGYAAADEVKKFSFELDGKIMEVAVEKGDAVKAGQTLARLDTQTVKLAIDNAKKNLELANNQIVQIDSSIEKLNISLEAERITLEKAQTNLEAEEINLKKIDENYNSNIATIQLQYNNSKDTLDNIAALYNQGVAAKVDYDNARLAFDTVQEQLANVLESKENDLMLQQKKIDSIKNDLQLQESSIKNIENDISTALLKREAAVISVNQVQISIEQNTKYLNDSVLKSTIDGYVMEVPMKSGEVTGAGTPVVIVKSGRQIVNIAIPAEEYSNYSVGMKAYIDTDTGVLNGSVSSIALYPDEATRTYNMKILPEDDNRMVMGELVSVRIPVGSVSGCFVPVNAILSIDGVDYVYYIEQSKEDGLYVVRRREVALGAANDGYVMADGVETGMYVITDGVKDVSENCLVKADISE